MSKGRDVVVTRALDESECVSVQAFSLQEMESSHDAFHVLQEREEQEGKSGVEVEEVSRHSMEVLTAQQLEELQKQAYQEAYEKGLAEGREAGHAQALTESRQQSAQHTEQFQAILQSFSEPLQTLDDEVVDELISMVITVAKHLIRRELKSEPGQIIAVTREALAALPMNSRQIKLHLHPEDALLVKETLLVAEGESPWHIVEDPTLSRGGLKVISENSQIDATVEGRLGEIISRVLGDQRGESSSE